MTASADLKWIEVDDYVAAFERAWLTGRVPTLSEFRAGSDHPQAGDILVELIRVDLECRSERNLRKSLDDYFKEFPECRTDAAARNAVAFEEYRLRLHSGEQVLPNEYASQYGCDVLSWPACAPPPASDGRALSTFVEIRNRADRTNTQFPEAGVVIAGFELLRELGRGAFSRVFLAKQGDLSGREVVVKISTLGFVESDRLAKLQHSHIVPIYSVHHTGTFSVVCMPYLGEATLADVLKLVQAPSNPSKSARLIQEVASNHCQSDRSLNFAAGRERTLRHSKAESPSDYVSAVLHLAELTADGLAYAHQCGILHRDIKPANILLTAEGRPLLLDFNLSQDLSDDDGADPLVGGTLPYMAPEQLQAYVARRESCDLRSDLFSFGVVFYELITGRHPFPQRRETSAEAAAATELHAWPVVIPANKLNSSATPAVSAILQRCLERRPEDRYQNAFELAEDLRLQNQNRPLRYAADSSIKERLGKWARRHPRLTSAGSISLIAAVILLFAVSGLVMRSRQISQLNALATRQRFNDEFQVLQARSLVVDSSTASAYESLIADCHSLLDVVQVDARPDWWNHEIHRVGSVDDQRRLRADVGEVFFLMTLAAQRQHGLEKDAQRRAQLHSDAKSWLNRSRSSYAELDLPRALGILESMTDDEKHTANGLGDKSFDASDSASIRDNGMAATMLLVQRRPREALPYWQRLCRVAPHRFWVQFGLGYCYEQLKQWTQANACYSACIALDSTFTDAYFRRGLCLLRNQEFDLSLADYDAVLERKAQLREATLNRATALIGLKRYSDAIAGLEQAFKSSPRDARVGLMLATALDRNGDAKKARDIRREVLAQEISDPDTLVARGVSRIAASPIEALGDFDAALRIDPAHLPALESKAHVLSEKLGNLPAALDVLDRAVSAYPEEASLRAGRGVLLARIGKRETAFSDAKEALALSESDAIRYQVAGIHALLAEGNPHETQTALSLLAGALRHGYGLNILDRDPDLESLRAVPKFLDLKNAATALDEADSQYSHGQ